MILEYLAPLGMGLHSSANVLGYGEYGLVGALFVSSVSKILSGWYEYRLSWVCGVPVLPVEYRELTRCFPQRHI